VRTALRALGSVYECVCQAFPYVDLVLSRAPVGDCPTAFPHSIGSFFSPPPTKKSFCCSFPTPQQALLSQLPHDSPLTNFVFRIEVAFQVPSPIPPTGRSDSYSLSETPHMDPRKVQVIYLPFFSLCVVAITSSPFFLISPFSFVVLSSDGCSLFLWFFDFSLRTRNSHRPGPGLPLFSAFFSLFHDVFFFHLFFVLPEIQLSLFTSRYFPVLH